MTTTTSLLSRNDTMLGICQAIGEDLGFSPNWIRIALALGLFLNPLAVAVTYAGLGVLVLASRLLFPVAGRNEAAEVQPTAATPVAHNDSVEPELPLAA